MKIKINSLNKEEAIEELISQLNEIIKNNLCDEIITNNNIAQYLGFDMDKYKKEGKLNPKKAYNDPELKYNKIKLSVSTIQPNTDNVIYLKLYGIMEIGKIKIIDVNNILI